ncbi:cell filamentation protein Fic [Ectothiorhodospira shaposhnikovii]|uniref:Fic family protein n=1 Tax=Ectothiorhodospira shaposhnikovii TaxID=1054 RepID=UPI001A91CCBC|nr:Fic family protein [Ectothiorhodospira shaposhnikovii]MBK1674750.1 cell filamentation protein Fic [Ectothiorhodospira shaposhnikovii]
MPSPEELLESIRSAPEGLSIAAILDRHPGLARRTAQRWLNELVVAGRIKASGAGRARRYVVAAAAFAPSATIEDVFPRYIPLSADSRDILAYVNQPLTARKPVGYQRDFLDAYQPNQTWYLPEPLRRQLRKMGDTGQTRLPAGTYGRAVLNRLLIDLSWASSHLEGNTYTRLDTRELIEHGRIAQGKAAIETQMILNHKAAIEFLVENADTAGFNRFTLLNLHSALSENLLPNPADEGRLRQHGVEIGKSVYRPLAVPAQVEEMLDLLLDKANRVEDPFEQSFFVMVHVPYLQPFADVNKRTSRLTANLPLIRANLCPLTFLDVPEQAYSRAVLGVYELTRIELLRDLYVWAYERSTQEYLAIKQDLAEPDPLRLAWREVIKQSVREVVRQPGRAPLDVIKECLSGHELGVDRDNIEALVIEELRRLHEGVLARYGLRPSEFSEWQSRQWPA